MRIYFDLSGLAPDFNRRWRERIDTWLAADPGAIDSVDQPTGRLPVILSYSFVPPVDPAWRDCVLQPPETRLGELPAFLAEADRRWPELAARASAYWRENYADDRMARTLTRHLSALLPARPPGPGHRLRLARFAVRQGARDISRRLLGLLRR